MVQFQMSSERVVTKKGPSKSKDGLFSCMKTTFPYIKDCVLLTNVWSYNIETLINIQNNKINMQ